MITLILLSLFLVLVLIAGTVFSGGEDTFFAAGAAFGIVTLLYFATGTLIFEGSLMEQLETGVFFLAMTTGIITFVV